MTYATQLGVLALGAIATLASARMLGPSGRGAFQVLQTLAIEIGTAGSLGILVSAVYFAARFELPRERIVGALMCLVAILGIVVTTLVWAFRSQLADLFFSTEPPTFAILLVGPLSALWFGSTGLVALYRGANRFHRFNALTLAVQGLFVGSLVLGLAIAGADVQTAIAASVIGYALAVLLLITFVWRDFGVSLSRPFEVIWRLVCFNFLGHVGTFLQQLSYRLDIFILAAARGTTEVGYYAVAVAISQVLWYLPNSLGNVLLSRTAAGEREGANARLTAVCQLVVPILIVIVGVVAATGPWTIPLAFGQDFAPASTALLLLAPGIVALGLWKVLANDLAGRGVTVAKLESAGPGAVVTVTLDLLLIPRFGLEGAAVASSAAYITTCAVIVWRTSRITGIAVRHLLVLNRKTLSLVQESLRRPGRSPTNARTQRGRTPSSRKKR